ncbi:YggS family pyridoxal phosphate-dependent enzyme [Nocardia blacklockiae]|uniref:YggS family pyridoxal phosphate-dependent enzyme n=1 Tax=Nocardia blacklockiae TaxID=480036 RepID=UPI00189321BA|nr:YggS family pyridoxal phosphate-dependent enzyme [Nocardia blacklockiae]MBF6174152.1 YggS family pyridoxal phosphate-dependent enzyme [Nocardia blacklockiae]
MTRTAELSRALTGLSERIESASRAAGRDPAEIRLLPVTKFFPASDIALLYELGRREFGESREQEAAGKVADLGQLSEVRWHMIGRLQRNKAKSVARWAYAVHSVDSERLAAALDAGTAAAREAGLRDTPLRVLLQVSLDSDPSRGGVAPHDLPRLADQVAETEHLELAGLMAIPPLGADPEPEFARLAKLHERLRIDHPEATELSAGMSGDLEAAIRHGSTCVRVGTALMGTRPITSG